MEALYLACGARRPQLKRHPLDGHVFRSPTGMSTTQKILFGLLVLALGVSLVFFETRVRDPFEGHLCVQWYKEARTPAETSLVDTRRPPLQRAGADYTGPIPTCGELRQLGRVR